MKVKEILNRETYINEQITRSSIKFRSCKVGTEDVRNYKKVLQAEGIDFTDGPIICLGTRNGREIDLFRNIFFGNPILNFFIKLLETKRYGFSSLFGLIEGFSRSDVNSLSAKSAIGVEINPEAQRSDTLIASFDEMPKEWENKFKIIYSNSFDQSQDPLKTANEWKRIALKKRGYFYNRLHNNASNTIRPCRRLIDGRFQKSFWRRGLIFFQYAWIL
jgi:hypothetical protein